MVDSFANMFLSNVTNDIGTGPPPCHVQTVIAAMVILRCALALIHCACPCGFDSRLMILHTAQYGQLLLTATSTQPFSQDQ